MIRDKGEDISPGSPAAAESPAAPAGPMLAPKAGEAVEQLWGSVFLSPERTAPKAIVVTSAESGEGATQVAAGLALAGSSTEYGLRIALVEFDVRRPKIAALFGVRSVPGLAEVICDEVALADALVQPDNDRLDILPAGRTDDSSLRLLQSPRVGELVRELAASHDHVIIDAPAVNRCATAQTLAGLTDGVLLVVKAGVTRRESIAEAKKRIEYAQGKLIGVALNQREFPIPAFLYRRL